ncbi:MAG: SIR2 family protein [Spirochaetaceae bacterium]|jgi:hypothetical protein|nr:SIR2 family protein [Spirochaetaceae bacterium]
MQAIEFGIYNDEISSKVSKSARLAGRDDINIEDQIRVANELLAGLRILGSKDAEKLALEIKIHLGRFAKSILRNECFIASSHNEKAEVTLIRFLLSFASRTGGRDRLNIFTTNYDRIIEMGAELAGLHLIDRFVGNLTPIFRASRLNIDMHYNPPGIRGEPRYLEGVVRYTKLHGSVDWIAHHHTIQRIGLPLGAKRITPYLKAPGLAGCSPLEIMIYPNADKERETLGYPYTELFRDFAAAICRPNSTLVTYGYSFGDEHINRIIMDMLTIPSTHLVIISYSDPLGRIIQTFQEKPDQISLLLGSELGDISKLTENYLPKAAIDNASARMADILRKRSSQHEIEEKGNKGNGENQE